jgi:8-oxo-dGTP pyrophosphatase MutT (NUDIX family)
MSGVFDHLSMLYKAGHSIDAQSENRPQLLSDGAFASGDPITKAAVLIAVTERSGADREPGVILTQRPATMRDHPGQVAFPGGKIDHGESPLDAALREAEEELGMARDTVRIIGPTDRYITGTGFDITPVLAAIPPDLPLEAEPREVESWFEAPLSLLMDKRNWQKNSAFYRGAQREYYELDYQGYRVWGVTAGIIINLAERLQWMSATNAR